MGTSMDIQPQEEHQNKFQSYLIFTLKAILFFSLLIIVSFFMGFALHYLIDVTSGLFN